MNGKKWPDRLWSAVSGLLTLILFPSSSWRPKSFKVKTAWSGTSMLCLQKSKSLLSPFSVDFHRGSRVKKRVHMYPTFVSQSSYPHEFFSFIEALVPTIDGTWYEHLFRTTVSVPPKEAELFPVLPWIILIWFIFLRVSFVWKQPHPFQILQYFCL